MAVATSAARTAQSVAQPVTSFATEAEAFRAGNAAARAIRRKMADGFGC